MKAFGRLAKNSTGFWRATVSASKRSIETWGHKRMKDAIGEANGMAAKFGWKIESWEA